MYSIIVTSCECVLRVNVLNKSNDVCISCQDFDVWMTLWSLLECSSYLAKCEELNLEVCFIYKYFVCNYIASVQGVIGATFLVLFSWYDPGEQMGGDVVLGAVIVLIQNALLYLFIIDEYQNWSLKLEVSTLCICLLSDKTVLPC